MKTNSILAVVLIGAACAREQPVSHEGPLWREAQPGHVPTVVRQAARDAEAAHRQLLVYVGATWCEPCQRFHAALLSGALDQAFSDVTFLAFDYDQDAARLAEAGYSSRLIPLLAVPDANGRASGRQMQGSIKGEGAVAEMTPRLKALLGR